MTPFDPLKDPFRVLGVARDGPAEAVDEAYRRLVRQHPPQRDPARFKQVRDAYERLTSPEGRLEALLFTLDPPEPGNSPEVADLVAVAVDALVHLAAAHLGLEPGGGRTP